jgi:hypothetical protein
MERDPGLLEDLQDPEMGDTACRAAAQCNSNFHRFITSEIKKSSFEDFLWLQVNDFSDHAIMA